MDLMSLLLQLVSGAAGGTGGQIGTSAVIGALLPMVASFLKKKAG